jgi:hypothetical protein
MNATYENDQYTCYTTKEGYFMLREKLHGYVFRMKPKNDILYEPKALVKKIAKLKPLFFPLVKKLASMTDQYTFQTRASKSRESKEYLWIDGYSILQIPRGSLCDDSSGAGWNRCRNVS